MNFAQPIDFAGLMEPVAVRLLGEPNLKLSNPPCDVRFGSRGSISADFVNGRFYDHETKRGGGVLDLISHKTGRNRGEAQAWLKREGIFNAPPSSGPRPAQPMRQLGKIVATYDYIDEKGDVLFQVVRYDPKDFRQRRPARPGDDPAKVNNGWVWGVKDTRLVPYRVPDLIKAQQMDGTSFIVEGEKDADNLRALGFVATTNPGGAGKWRREFSAFFTGSTVVLIADNDDAGRSHVEQVAASLYGVAVEIRILNVKAQWPECDPKGDISDWIVALGNDSQGVADKLKEVVKTLLPWGPASYCAGSDSRSDASSGAQGDTDASVDHPYSERPWPVLDGAALYGLAGDVVKTLNPHTEADPVGILVQFLTAFGNLIGNNAYYQVESDRHHANLFSVHVGASAKGPKGTAGGRVRAVTRLADEIWADERTASGLSSGEGLINAVRDPVQKWDAKAKQFETVDPGVTDKRLMISEPEFAGALSAMERHGNTLSPVIRNAWDGQKLQTLTKASPLKATGAHISIIAHITEEEARTRLTRTEMANGFANRFLFCCVRRSKLLPHGGALPESELADLAQRVKAAVEFARQVGRVEMTAEAAGAWAAAYPELSAERPGLVGAIIARAEAQVIRLALIFALLDQKDSIAPGHLEAAMAVWAYCEASALRIFGDSLGDPVADDILRALRQSAPSGMTRTEIYNLFGRHRTSDQIGAALQLLRTKSRVRSETRETSGRPSEVWFAVGGAS